MSLNTDRPDTLDALRSGTTGAVLLPDDPSYDAARTGFQTHRPHRPDVLVRAASAADVSAAVRFAAAHDLPVGVLGSGHGLPRRCEGGVLVVTRDLGGVTVEPSSRTASIDAGTRWADVIAASAAHGLAPLSGSSPQLAAIAYTVGGGLSMIGRTFGWAADHVNALDVVTADGQRRRVDESTDSDLFWALRGGGGHAGIITGMEIGLMPVATMYAGSLLFDAPDLRRALTTWARWAQDAPDEITTSVAMVPFPDSPDLPETLRGRHILQLRVAHIGDSVAGERLIRPLRQAAPVLMDSVQEMPYAEVATITNDPTTAMPYTGSSRTLKSLGDNAIESILRLAGPGSDRPGVVEIRQLGGALGRAPQIPNAVGGRASAFSIGLTARLTSASPSDDELASIRARHDSLWDALASSLDGGVLLNFLPGDATPEDLRRAFGPEAYQRLRSVLSAYDPRQLFGAV